MACSPHWVHLHYPWLFTWLALAFLYWFILSPLTSRLKSIPVVISVKTNQTKKPPVSIWRGAALPLSTSNWASLLSLPRFSYMLSKRVDPCSSLSYNISVPGFNVNVAFTILLRHKQDTNPCFLVSFSLTRLAFLPPITCHRKSC